MRRKPMFDIIRRLLGRPLRQREVDAIDAAFDQMILPEDSAATASPRQVGTEGIALIKRFEGCAKRRADGAFEAYPDPGTGGEPWTIGWGATGRDHVHGGRIANGTVWSAAECDARLESDLARYAAEVAAAIGDAPTSQRQFDAMVSFHYNTGAIARATLTKKHRAGDHEGASLEFARWRFAGGRVMRGLEKRRAAESSLYRG